MMVRLLIAGAAAALLPACFPRVDWVDTGVLHDVDGDGYWDYEDCAPDDPGIHPGAAEFCNGVDDDCDGLVDDDDRVLGTTRWAPDEDQDGFGAASEGIEACEKPDGYVDNAWDCDDTDPAVNPDAVEICDGVDNDCDRRVDVDAEGAPTWYPDDDGDGYGRDDLSQVACEQPAGFVAEGGDCDDATAGIHPDATEVCDGVDQDCDGAADEDVVATFYRDRDGDGWGDPEVAVVQCPLRLRA
jgi:hypothetical protein